MPGNSNTDSKIETYLRERGVEFHFLEKVPPGSFDAERSLENQARLGAPLNSEVVERYIEAAKGGDVFPPVIAYRLPSNQLEILDGNHRRAAFAELGLGMDVYVVDASTQPAMRSLITFEANTKHGLPSTEQDRLHHALFMVDNGTSVREASKMFGVPQHRLQKTATLKLAARRAEDTRVPPKKWEQLPPGVQLKLNTITTDEGFQQAAELVADAGLNSASVTELVKELNRNRSAAKQRQAVEVWRAEHAAQIQETATRGGTQPSNRGAVTKSPKGRLQLGFGQIKYAFSGVEIETLSPTQREELAGLVEQIMTELNETIKRLQDA